MPRGDGTGPDGEGPKKGRGSKQGGGGCRPPKNQKGNKGQCRNGGRNQQQGNPPKNRQA